MTLKKFVYKVLSKCDYFNYGNKKYLSRQTNIFIIYV